MPDISAGRSHPRAPVCLFDVRLAVKGTQASEVWVRATDRRSGRVVFNEKVKLVKGVAEIDQFPFGIIHWDVAGALNFFFVRDVDVSTAYSYFGGGPLFYAKRGGNRDAHRK
ncbi:hypothetical protein [Noviherbaspirillum sp.]|uniref:hypothetical protein n=1 Tax=Noviherbaspirillum sp. TaxID=1926288 RepID=UPI002B4916A0|nr:hypothetical protein [Noviherbaspirillum sp.]HJV80668.1 hypothetical protein [Noviherbaspirillum sp.]